MTPDLSIKTNQTVGKRIAANAGLMIGAKAIGAVFGVGTLIVAERALGPTGLGLIVFLHAYMLFFADIFKAQTWQSMIRFGSVDVKEHDVSDLSRLLNFGYRLDIISVFFAYIASILLMGLVKLYLAYFPEFSPKGVNFSQIQGWAAIYCMVIFVRIQDTSIGVLRLFDKFTLLALAALVMPIIHFFGSLYALYKGWGLKSFILIWMAGAAANYMSVSFLGLRELTRRNLLQSVMRANPDMRKERKGLWPYIGKSSVDTMLASATIHLPVLMVMGVFGAAWVAIYKIAEEIAKLLTEAFKLLDQVIYPELARLVAEGQANRIWAIVLRASAILLCLGLSLSWLILQFGGPVLESIFGPEFRDAAPLASLLVPAAAIMGVAAPLYPVFYAADKPQRAIYVRGATLVIYLFVFVILARLIGEMAPGWAALIANIFAVVFVVILGRQTIKAVADKQKHEVDLP